MKRTIYTPLQIREIFHLTFLRWLARDLDAQQYVLKGGVNLRLFFNSIRYSEDMDIDIQHVRVDRIQKVVMSILTSRAFCDTLKSFGVDRVVAPDLSKAKQTHTTQRFKIHLLTSSNEDLFTKVEFSRRGLKGDFCVDQVALTVLRPYKMMPILVSHYDASSAVAQKILALAGRSIVQARDVFDLFILHSQCDEFLPEHLKVSSSVLKKAHENLFQIEFAQFRDTVVAYLKSEDQAVYDQSATWDEIKLNIAHFLEEQKQ